MARKIGKLTVDANAINRDSIEVSIIKKNLS